MGNQASWETSNWTGSTRRFMMSTRLTMSRTKLEFKLYWSLLKEFLELYSKTQFRTRLGSCQGMILK